MNKKLKKTSITDDINSKAKEIINQDNRTSLEAKKFEFCNFLDEYYNKLSGDSELLITRKEEINFYSTTSKDFYSSILISILTSAMISFLFWILDKTEEIYKSMPNSSFILNIILSAIFSGGILVFLYYVIKVLNNIFTPYEKGVNGVFGLGLSIVKKTLHFLNYDISIENVKNGVKFTIY